MNATRTVGKRVHPRLAAPLAATALVLVLVCLWPSLVVLVLGGVALLWLTGAVFMLDWREMRARQWSRRGLCPHCGYDLRASAERCPECGHPREAEKRPGGM